MLSQQKLEEITDYLTQTLTEYEVIPANFGWHIHFGDKYYGQLEYNRNKGWRGDALNHLPSSLVEQLKKINQSNYSMYTTTIGGNLPFVA
jgi:hypothetical protein